MQINNATHSFESANETINNYVCINMTTSATYLIKECECALLYPKDPHRQIRLAVEFILTILALTTLILSLKELYTEKFKLYLKILIGNPTKFLYLTSCVLI